MKSFISEKKGRALQLFLSQHHLELKLFFRETSAVIWTFIFPLILISVIGWFWGPSTKQLDVFIIDDDQSKLSQGIPKTLSISPEINHQLLPENTNFQPEHPDLSFFENKESIILHIPKGFESSIQQKKPLSLSIYYQSIYDESIHQRLGSFYALFPKLNEQISLQPVMLKMNYVQTNTLSNLSYMHFVYPGILALSILSTGIFGVALRLSSYREKGQLKRIALTPLKKWEFILPHIFSRYVITLIQTSFLMIFTYVTFGISLQGNILSLLIVISLGLFTFISMGFVIACRTEQAETASAVANFIFLPLMFLGGVYFPIDNSSPLLKTISELLPLLPFTNALRGIINHGEPLLSVLPGLWPLPILIIICFMLSIGLFRWN